MGKQEQLQEQEVTQKQTKEENLITGIRYLFLALWAICCSFIMTGRYPTKSTKEAATLLGIITGGLFIAYISIELTIHNWEFILSINIISWVLSLFL